MGSTLLDSCSEWNKNKSCECTLLSENNNILAQAPKAVRESINKSNKAWSLINKELTREKYLQTESLRNSNPDKLLSQLPNSPYKILEAIQKSSCNNPNNKGKKDCKFDQNYCDEFFQNTTSVFGDEDFKTNHEIKKILCHKISTAYEFPGTYEMLNRYFVELSLAAEIEGIKLDNDFAYGSLPSNKINVSITPDQSQGTRLILFNRQFFSFVYEMVKVASLSIPFHNKDTGLEQADLSTKGVESYLNENPNIEKDFVEMLFSFLDIYQQPIISPPKNIQPLLVTFGFGAEEFAMAHEMAHAILNHSNENKLSFEPNGCDSKNEGSWIEEVEADYLGMKLLSNVADIRSACSGAIIDNENGLSVVGKPIEFCESHPFSIGIPLAAVTYFTAQEIKEDACRILKDGASSTPDSIELELLQFSNRCKANQDCNFLRDVRQNLSKSLLEMKGHPHPTIRKEFAKIWINQQLLNNNNAVSSIGTSIFRNSEIMWARSRNKISTLRVLLNEK